MASFDGTDAGKASIRSNYLSLCENMPKDFSRRVDATVRDMLDRLDLYQATSLVLSYLPIHEELDTFPIMREVLAQGKRLALPYLDSAQNKLEFYEVRSLSSISRGSRGLARPPYEDAQPLTTQDFLGSVCLVPGLVFDAEGNRVGYGAGYYDEFLAYYPGDKIGLVRSVQISSNPLPTEKHDVPVDVLVTEGSIWRCRRVM